MSKNAALVKVDWPSDIELDADMIPLRNALFERVDEIAEDVVDEARRSTAFKDKTGDLRKSIKVVKKKRRDDGEDTYVAATDPASHLVEFGHVQTNRKKEVIGHVPAHPFLRPALEKVINKLRSELAGIRR